MSETGLLPAVEIEELKKKLDACRKRCHEYRAEAFRCRRIAKFALEESKINGVCFEIYPPPKGSKDSVGIVVCAPGMDESNLGEAVLMVMRQLIGDDKATLSSVQITGTNATKVP